MKKITLAVILTLLINIFCLPLWTECDYGGFVRTLFNKEAQLDLLYYGQITAHEPFHFKSTLRALNNTSAFYQADNSQRRNLNFRAREKWQKISLNLEPLRDGKITILLEGRGVFDEYGNSYLVLTDWKNLKVNGKTIFDETKTLSFQKCFSMQIPVKKDGTLHVEAEFRRHHFTIHDFTFLRHENLWFFITGNLLSFFLIYRLVDCIRGGGYSGKRWTFFSRVFYLLWRSSDIYFGRGEEYTRKQGTCGET